MSVMTALRTPTAFLRDRATWPVLLAGALFIVIAVLSLTTFRDYGIGWDGRVQDVYGQKLLAYYLSGFRDQSAFTYSDLRFYGGFFDLVAAVLNRVSPFGEFETRHLLGAAIFLAGLAGAWRLTRLIAGERAAAIAVICLASTPALYGHAFINPKDSPFAWLLVWVTYFACRIIDRRQKVTAATYVGFAVSLGLALGTKVFAVAYVGYLLAIILGGAVAARWQDRRVDPWPLVLPVLRPLLWALPVACLIMTVFWPWAMQAPHNFLQSIATFLRFPHHVPVLWEGETISSTNPPLSYLIVLLGLKLPEHVLLGLALACFFAARALRRRFGETLSSTTAQQLLFVAMSGLVPIIAFVLLRPTAYNGIRQYLFVLPPLIILAAISLDRVLALAIQWRSDAAVAAGLLLAFAITHEARVMHSVHPYEYVAFNALAGDLAHAGREFELDYWGTSLAEAARNMPGILGVGPTSMAGLSHAPKVFICGDNLSAEYFMPRSIEVTNKVAEADFLMESDATVCAKIQHRPARSVLKIVRDGAVLGQILDLRPPAGQGLAHL